MRRNVSGQYVGCQMVSSSDGTAFTSTVTVYVTGDAGTQALGSVGSGVCTHEGNGFHTYAPAQAETNYTHVAFTFIGTGAIPATVQVYPTAYDANGRVDVGAVGGTSQTAGDLAALITTVDTVVDSILTDTAEIGAAGAGLTAVPWNAAWDAEVQSEVEDGLIAHGLDHLVGASVADTDVADNSIVAKLVDSTAITADFTNYDWTTDSLRAIRDQGDSAWITATGFSTHSAADVWSVATRVLTANTNLNDPTAAAIADAVWDEAIAGHLSAGSTGEALSNASAAGDPWATALPGAYGAGTAGKIVGDYINAPIATVDTVVDAIKAVTDNLPDSGALTTIGNNVAAVLADTGTDGVVVAAASKTGYQLAAAGSAALTEGYASLGSTATLPQLLYEIRALLAEKSISGTTLTAKKLDGATTAATYTLDDATTPSAITRAT